MQPPSIFEASKLSLRSLTKIRERKHTVQPHWAKYRTVEALSQQAQWRHIRVEDGPGRALGRSFRVKLWPTLVLLRDGQEVARLVRPTQTTDISAALNVA